MGNATRLDQVTAFEGKLSFLIPHDWEERTEQESHDHYAYSAPGAHSGWLRVSLVTAEAQGETPAEMIKRIFCAREGASQDGQTGNWVWAYEKDTQEDGVEIHIYYWMVANLVPPNLVREAVFSLTVLSDRVRDDATTTMVGILTQTVTRADFLPKTQNRSESSVSRRCGNSRGRGR